jgi:hypothetical protein
MENWIMMQIPTYQEIQEIRKILSSLQIEHWKKDDLFDPTWWFLLLATILPYFLWWRIVDKERFFEIFSFGLLTGTVSTFLDVIGVDLLLWGYPDKLLSMVPPLFPADITIIPVTSMILYQYVRTWKTYFLFTVLLALVFAYIIEPLFVKFGMFSLDNWKHSYSLIAFILFFLANRVVFYLINKRIKRK